MSKKVGLFFGTTTGVTESVAETIKELLGEEIVDLYDISEAEAGDFSEYEY